MNKAPVKITPAVGLLAVVLLFIVAAVLALPAAFFLMLFLGNLGLHLSFIACLPGAMVIAALKSTTSSTRTK